MLPHTITIGPHTFTVVEMPQKLQEDYGVANLETFEIRIRNDIPLTLKQETLVHEIVHMMRIMLGVDLTDEAEEERIVQSEAFLLYLLLKQNDLKL